MTIELKIPNVGESVREVQIGKWLKQEGDAVDQDETVVELDTDKASMEVPAPASGVIVKILKHDGDTVAVGEVIARLETGGPPGDSKAAKDAAAVERKPAGEERRDDHPADKVEKQSQARETVNDSIGAAAPAAAPSVRRLLREHHLAAQEVKATGEGGRLLREDVLRHVEKHDRQSETSEEVESRVPSSRKPAAAAAGDDMEHIVPMSLVRRRIAERLVEARQTAALLTTFNEIDMSSVIALRTSYRDLFHRKYGVKLGFMSFFVKAVVDALVEVPVVNAEVRGTDVVYRGYCHIGVAIGGAKGLVVPVLRHAQKLSFAEIEQAIDDFARRAESNKLEPGDLAGGTFTISNGGIYGSLLSTPIVNPPQSGVLGMHAILERPVARGGEVVVRPMMYVALTYDHRIVDGREAVTFLKRVKETIEEPSRMLVGI